MTFPFHLHVGFIYDLRFIPIILVFLYGNTKTLFYRHFISFLPVLLRRKWRSSIIYYLYYHFCYNNALFVTYYLCILKKKDIIKLTSYFSMYSFLSICGIVTQINTGGKIDSTLIEFLLNYIVINIFTVLLSVYFIEEMIEKYKMKKTATAEKFYIASELASIAHEIHNPLTTVHGFTQLLNEKHASKLSQDQYLEIMLIEMRQIQSTINNYLSLTKPQNTLKEKIDINHILNQVKDTISPLALSYKVEIKQNSTDSFYINGDPENSNSV